MRLSSPPKQKQQSKQWIETGGNTKKTKTVPLAGKVMETVFWGFKGILLIDYLQKGKIINSEYLHKSTLHKFFWINWVKKYQGVSKEKIIFHQDNAPTHKRVLTMAKINELKY